jgi:N-acetylglucosamine-6-phosphate deacetylase
MDGTLDAYITAATLHAKYGTTAIMPTLTTGPDEDMVNSFKIFHQAKNSDYNGAKFLGIHMEGPFFSAAQAGAQDPRYLTAPKKEHYEKLYNASEGAIARWSMAPELPGAAEFGKFLTEKGVLASIGHTNAIYDEVLVAFESGFNLLTHFYSSMSTITRNAEGYRQLGVIESGYVIDDMNVELIADGHHLPKEILKLVYKSKGANKIALVTDSMRGAGMPDGDTVLGNRDTGLKCIIDKGVAKLPDKTAFAGSIATTNQLVRVMHKLAEVSLVDSVKMMTLTPARLIGMAKTKGSIAVGKDADLVLFDDDINISMTIVEGKTVYTA